MVIHISFSTYNICILIGYVIIGIVMKTSIPCWKALGCQHSSDIQLLLLYLLFRVSYISRKNTWYLPPRLLSHACRIYSMPPPSSASLLLAVFFIPNTSQQPLTTHILFPSYPSHSRIPVYTLSYIYLNSS